MKFSKYTIKAVTPVMALFQKQHWLLFKQGYDNLRSTRRESAASADTARSGRCFRRNQSAVCASHNVPSDSLLPFHNFHNNKNLFAIFFKIQLKLRYWIQMCFYCFANFLGITFSICKPHQLILCTVIHLQLLLNLYLIVSINIYFIFIISFLIIYPSALNFINLIPEIIYTIQNHLLSSIRFSFY